MGDFENLESDVEWAATDLSDVLIPKNGAVITGSTGMPWRCRNAVI